MYKKDLLDQEATIKSFLVLNEQVSLMLEILYIYVGLRIVLVLF